MDILKAIKKLDTENNDHWTGTGLPSVDAVGAIVGATVTRKQIGEAAPGYDRDTARKGELVSGEAGSVSSIDQDDQSDEAPPSPELNGDGDDIDLGDLDDQRMAEIENLKNQNDALVEEIEALKDQAASSGVDNDVDPISLLERAVAASKHDRYARNYALKSFLGAWASNCEEAKQMQARLDLRNEARNK